MNRSVRPKPVILSPQPISTSVAKNLNYFPLSFPQSSSGNPLAAYFKISGEESQLPPTVIPAIFKRESTRSLFQNQWRRISTTSYCHSRNLLAGIHSQFNISLTYFNISGEESQLLPTVIPTIFKRESTRSLIFHHQWRRISTTSHCHSRNLLAGIHSQPISKSVAKNLNYFVLSFPQSSNGNPLAAYFNISGEESQLLRTVIPAIF